MPFANNPHIAATLGGIVGGGSWHPLFVHPDYDAEVLGQQVLKAWDGYFEPFSQRVRQLSIAAKEYFRDPYIGGVQPQWTAPLAFFLLGSPARAMDEWVAWRWSERYDWMTSYSDGGFEQALYEELGAIRASLQP